MLADEGRSSRQHSVQYVRTSRIYGPCLWGSGDALQATRQWVRFPYGPPFYGNEG